jgi:hypothetical protein
MSWNSRATSCRSSASSRSTCTAYFGLFYGLPFLPDAARPSLRLLSLFDSSPFTMLLPFTNSGLLLLLGDLSCFPTSPLVLPSFSFPVTERRPCSISEVEILRGVGVTELRRLGWGCGLGVGLGLGHSKNLPVLMYCM